MKKLLFSLATAALVIALGTAGAAQTTPYPSPQATMAPAPTPEATATPMPSTATSPPAKRGLLNRLHGLRGLLHVTLPSSQVRYAVTHQSQELAKLKSMKRVSFTNLRFYKVPPSMLPQIKAWRSQQAYEPSIRLNDALAQSSNPFLNIFANVVVTNALNNILNNNNVTVSLNDILNANKIGIGQVVGLFINGGGIITTIVS